MKLAIDGGKKTRNSGFPGWPFFGRDEIKKTAMILASGKVNQWTGTEVDAFAEEFAQFHHIPHAVPLANGSLALELAWKVLGLGKGDEVIVSPRSFIASASSIAIAGATPVFVDIDPDSQNIDPLKIEAALTGKTRAVLAVHLAGWPCNLDKIKTICRKHSLKLVEDCAQSLGAKWKEKPVGTLGDIGAFSFCQDKIITTAGEGGMLICNRKAYYNLAWSYKDHGKSLDVVKKTRNQKGFKWLHESLGTNWRLTEIQAGIGRLQLKKLDGWVKARRRNAHYLIGALAANQAISIPVPDADVYHSYYKFYLFIRKEKLKKSWSRDRIVEAIIAEGIPAFTGSCSEIYLEKAWRKLAGFKPPDGRLSVAKELGETSVMLLVHPTLSLSDMKDAADAVNKVLEEAYAG